jgi:hypothetical protein
MSAPKLSQPAADLNCEDAGQSVARAFLDAEEVRGSNPLAPTNESPGQRPFLARPVQKEGGDGSGLKQLETAFRARDAGVRYGDLTYREVAPLATSGAVAIVPLGCTEQQGPHLPVDFDTWFAEALMTAASEKAQESSDVQSLVLPALLPA